MVEDNGPIQGTSSTGEEPPFFSIVIPTYNRANAIATALDSCFRQTFGHFEIVLVDDGSTDGTLEIVGRIQDDRLRVIERENGGAAAARNTGVAEARGEYIAFLDSDDRFLQNKLEVFHRHIQTSPVDVLYSQMYVDRGVGRYWIKPPTGIRRDENMFDYLLVRAGWICPSATVVKREYARRVHFDETLTYGDDMQYVVDLWKAGARFQMLESPLTIYADPHDSDRLSQCPPRGSKRFAEHARFFSWMERQQTQMSREAYAIYRAHHLSPHLARERPAAAFQEIWHAWRTGAYGMKSAIRQAIQTFTPLLYRRIADATARFGGVDPGTVTLEK